MRSQACNQESKFVNDEAGKVCSSGRLDMSDMARTTCLLHCSITPLLHCSTAPLLHYSTAPLLHYSTTPLLHCSTTPMLHYSTAPLLQCSTTLLLHYSTLYKTKKTHFLHRIYKSSKNTVLVYLVNVEGPSCYYCQRLL